MGSTSNPPSSDSINDTPCVINPIWPLSITHPTSGPSLLSLVRQDLHLRLSLAGVVMIATKVASPALVTLTEATLVRSNEVPVASEQATILFGLTVWISPFTSTPITVFHLPKLQNFVSPVANTSGVAGPSLRPFQVVLKVPTCFIFSSISWRPPGASSQRRFAQGMLLRVGSSLNPSFLALVAWVKDISKVRLCMNYFVVTRVVVIIHVLRSATLRK